MPDNKNNPDPQLYKIQLKGLTDGTTVDVVVTALQQIFRRKTREEIERALGRLPLTLTQKATKEQAIKIKGFLESKGALLKITYASPVSQPLKDRPGVQRKKATPSPVKPAPEPDAGGADRRRKPRVHPGFNITPMDIGEILDRSFRLLRQYFWLFFFILLIPQSLIFILTQGIKIIFRSGTPPVNSLAFGVTIGVLAFFGFLAFIVLQFWAQGALIFAVSETYLGHNTTLKDSYRAIKRLFWKFLGTMILWALLVFGIPAISGIMAAIIIPLFKTIGLGNLIIGVIIFILIIVAIWMFFRLFIQWLLVDKVIILEGIGGMQALHRSKELMKARTEPGFWKRPGIKAGLVLLVGFAIAIGINLFFQIPGGILIFIFKGSLVVETFTGLLDLTASALNKDPALTNFSGAVSDSGEGRWTNIAAIEAGVPVHVLSAALYDRFNSRDEADFANQLLSAMRYEFGGHHEKPAGKK